MWQIVVHKLVWEDDFVGINKHDQQVILKTIQKKLSLDPEAYGEPLKRNLKGYWKLKISHFRIIYVIEKDKIRVLVVKVGMRRDEQVYQEMLTRLDKL